MVSCGQCAVFWMVMYGIFFLSSRRRHTRCSRDWSSDVCSSDLDKPALKPEEVREILMKFQQEMMAKGETKNKADAEKNQKAGDAFLAENARKEGVKTTASGLQYKVLKSGSGASPKKTDSVKVHYHGTLIDGKVFDSSVQRGEPVTCQVGGVIPGWVEALQLMKVGDKWQLFIPAKLAYGEVIPDPVIGPNATLVFEVELLGIEKEK